MADKPLTLPELAERMGKPLGWMRQNLARVRRERGFPDPIPGFGYVWDPAAVDAWLARQRAPAPVSAPGGTDLTDDEWSDRLDQRALAMASVGGNA